jgi:hypothetical protein
MLPADSQEFGSNLGKSGNKELGDLVSLYDRTAVTLAQ